MFKCLDKDFPRLSGDFTVRRVSRGYTASPTEVSIVLSTQPISPVFAYLGISTYRPLFTLGIYSPQN